MIIADNAINQPIKRHQVPYIRERIGRGDHHHSNQPHTSNTNQLDNSWQEIPERTFRIKGIPINTRMSVMFIKRCYWLLLDRAKKNKNYQKKFDEIQAIHVCGASTNDEWNLYLRKYLQTFSFSPSCLNAFSGRI